MSHREVRIRNIEVIKKMIKKNPKQDMKSLAISISLVFGCTLKKAREYVKVANG